MDAHDLHKTSDFLEENGWPDEIVEMLREMANYKTPEFGALVRIAPVVWEEQYAKAPLIDEAWVANTIFGRADVVTIFRRGTRWFWPTAPDDSEGMECESIEEGKRQVEEWVLNRFCDGVEWPLYRYQPRLEIPF